MPPFPHPVASAASTPARRTRGRLPWGPAVALLTAVLGAPGLPAVRTPARPGKPAAPAPLTLVHPNGLVVAPDGSLYMTDIGTHRVLRLDPDGRLARVAGTGVGGFGGDGGAAVQARLFAPHDVALDRDGSLLIADTYNHRIRRVDRQGRISTVVGNGRDGLQGEGGPALRASLSNPQGIAVAPDGSLYIADTYNHVVRRRSPDGILTTFAGTLPGLAGDGGPANRGQLSLPMAVAVGPDGTVAIAEAGNNRIRLVSPGGILSTLLGTGPGSGTAGAGFGGDGGPVLPAKVFAPADLKFGPGGDLFLSDSGNHRVRRISQGIITTLVGTGTAGFGGDGGPAGRAVLNTPQKLAVGPDGTIWIADRVNHRVRRVTPDGRIATLGGGGRPDGVLLSPELRREGTGRQ